MIWLFWSAVAFVTLSSLRADGAAGFTAGSLPFRELI